MAGLAHMEVTCMRILGCCLLVLAWALFSAPAVAQEARIDPAVLTEGFLAAHPDLRWRAEGVRSYERKDYASALAMSMEETCPSIKSHNLLNNK